MNYRKDIDGLRTIAVLPVVLNHAGVAGFPGGFVGVDIFFVISGYLISTILLREMEAGRYSVVKFYERRARRILPALFFLLAAVGIIAAFSLPPGKLDSFSKSAIATLLFVSNAAYYVKSIDYFSTSTLTEPLLHTWSLAVEEQFYIVFPLLLLLLLRSSRSALTATVTGLTVASFAVAAATAESNQAFAFFLPITRVWELGVGVLLALGIAPNYSADRAVEAVAAAGFLAIAGSILLIDETTTFPGFAALPPVIGAAALIWAGDRRRTLASRLLSTRVFVGIGLISYSFYLWHWPVLVAFRLKLGSHDLPAPATLAAIILSLLLAWFSWRFVELPFRRRGPEGFSRKAIFTLSGTGIAVLLAIFGLGVATEGLRFRASPELLAVIEAKTAEPMYRECDAQHGFCELGDISPGPVEVLVWGDSHAGAMASGLDEYFTEHGLKAILASRNACAPLVGVYRADQRSFQKCVAHNESVIDFAFATPSIRMVIMIGRWPLSVEGVRAPGEPGRPALLRVIGDTRTEETLTKNAAAFSEGLHKTIAALKETGAQVVIVGGIPEIGVSVPDAMALSITIGAPWPVGPSLEATQSRQARANEIIKDVLVPGQVNFVNPVDVLCTDRCSIEVDGQPLYRDDDHISAFGAGMLTPLLLDEPMNDVFR